MPYWRLLYHVVWATKHRAPLVRDAMIEPISRAIEATAHESGITVIAVGVMPEHVHVFAQIPPSQAVATVIGRWKGSSSHAVNVLFGEAPARVAWQEGYGVLTVSQRGYDRVRDYVQNQRERHARQELYGALERTEDLIRKPL